ncbi:MAG: TIGR03009 domain-containing protein [Pirellulales bacterium]|nr:TIGR03009 domain-containing protein [Pirellulales bacterium]
MQAVKQTPASLMIALLSGLALLSEVETSCLAQVPPANGSHQNTGQPPQAGQAQGGQVQGGAQNQQRPPQVKAPFTLTREEFDHLWAVLDAWEKRSAQIKTAKANFTLWKDDPHFKKQTTQRGKVSYKEPDHGLYKVLGEDGDWVDHWVCDGKAIYDYNYTKKKISQFNLPPGLQGQNIANSPLPFLFAAKKDDLVQRYWMRLIPAPPERANDEIWIEAYPRTQSERADFVRATIILTRKELLPFAIELYSANNGRTVHQFDWKINSGSALDIFRRNEFEASVPRGWTKVVDPGMRDTSGVSSAGNGTVNRQH